MQKTYTTIIPPDQGYPFGIIFHPLSHFHHNIQIKFPLLNKPIAEYHGRFKKLLDLELLNSSIIKLNRIIHDMTKDQFVLVYEYVPFGLGDIFQLKIDLSKILVKMHHISQFLIQKKIRPIYSAKYFGFNENKELRYFLQPSFHEISNEVELKNQSTSIESKIKLLFKTLKQPSPVSPQQTFQDDKNSQRISERDLSAYNKKFQQKISLIESKLLLNRLGNSDNKLSNSQKIKRRKKLSHNFTEESVSISSSSSNSNKLSQTNQKSKSRQIQIQYSPRNSYNNEYEDRKSQTFQQKFCIKSSAPLGKKSSSQEEIPEKMPQQKVSNKLTNSLIIEEKSEEMQKLKHHKSSFGDYSTYGNSNCGNENEKEKKLKRRISFALEKSQNALKVYQKYQSMKISHPHNSKR